MKSTPFDQDDISPSREKATDAFKNGSSKGTSIWTALVFFGAPVFLVFFVCLVFLVSLFLDLAGTLEEAVGLLFLGADDDDLECAVEAAFGPGSFAPVFLVFALLDLVGTLEEAVGPLFLEADDDDLDCAVEAAFGPGSVADGCG